LPITPINFTDAEPGWRPGDALPPGATPVDAAALEGIQTHVGAYIDSAIAGIIGGSGGILPNIFNGTTFPARPGATVVVWIGGGPADDPFANMNNADIWIPNRSTVS
jgi:hypothetical protein